MIHGLLRLLRRRASSERQFVLARLVGLTLAVTVVSGVFIYLDALAQSALNARLEANDPTHLNIALRARTASISSDEHAELKSRSRGSIGDSIAEITLDPVWAAKTATLVFNRDEVAWPNARAFIATANELQATSDLVAGIWPVVGNGSLEVAISDIDARFLGATLGQPLSLADASDPSISFDVVVVGIFTRDDAIPEVWQAVDEGLGANSQAFRFAPLFVSEEAFVNEVPRLMPDSDARYYWILPVNPASVLARAASDIIADLDSQLVDLRQVLLGFQRITILDSILNEHIAAASISVSLMMAFGIVLAAACLSFVVLVAARARELRESESGIMRARGAAARQELILMAGETLAVAVTAMIVGPALAFVAVAFSGRLPWLEAIGNGANLPASITHEAVVGAGAVTAIGAVVMVLPSLTRSTTQVFQRLTRPPQLTIIQRYYLDVPILGLGIFVLWQLSRGELQIASDALGTGFGNQLASAMPAAVAIGAALIALRFMPIAMRAIGNGISRFQSALKISSAVTLSLWTLARNPRANFGMMLLVILVMSIATLVAVLGTSLELHATESAKYEVGADVRVSNMIVRSQPTLARQIRNVEALDGITEVSKAVRASGTASSASGTEAITVLGIDPDTFANVAHWRSDFGASNASGLVESVRNEAAAGVPIPPDTVMLTALVKPDLRRGDAGLTARLRGTSGRYYSLTIGTLVPRSVTLAAMERYPCEDVGFTEDDVPRAPQEWCRVGAPLTAAQLDEGEEADLTLEYIGITLRPSEEPTQLGVGSVAIADLSAVLANGSMVTLTSWADIALRRTPGGGFGEFGARLDPANRDGEGGAVLTWSQPTRRLIKGVKLRNDDAPVKVIGGRWFRDEAGFGIGDTMQIYTGQQEVEVQFIGFVDYFPTFGTARAPFLIADLSSVRDIIAIANPDASDVINELWIDLDDADDTVAGQIHELVTFALSGPPLLQRQWEERARFVADPLTVLGWNVSLIAGLASVVAVTALAFAVNGWTTYKLRSLEFAVLRSMGLTRRQWMWTIILEQTIPPLIASVIGISVGIVLSAVLLPYMVGADSDTVAPPILVAIGWRTFGLACGIIAIALAVSIGSVIIWTRRQQVNVVLRAGGGIA